MHRLPSVSARLKQTREALGLSQAAWCRLVGITAQAWNNYEKGTNLISLQPAIKVCIATGVSLDWIYRGLRSGLPHELAGKLVATEVSAGKARNG
jgi:transcriptional regulator with XRE-family HTH domain